MSDRMINSVNKIYVLDLIHKKNWTDLKLLSISKNSY
jgi:hypothetical protein